MTKGNHNPDRELALLAREHWPPRRQRRRRRLWPVAASRLLIVAGAVLLLVPVAWQAQAWWFQRQLEREAAISPPAQTENPVVPAPPEPRPVIAEAPPLVGEDPGRFTPFRVIIPTIKVDAWVVLGTTDAALKRGPGLYLEGVYPGDAGNTAIAGHRTGFGEWFRHLDRLRPGDPIFLQWGEDRFVYTVDRVFITHDRDWSVIDRTPGPTLTLTTCDPPGTADRRLIVKAWLDESFGDDLR